jgi:hypothetical protein
MVTGETHHFIAAREAAVQDIGPLASWAGTVTQAGTHTDKKENKIFLIYKELQMGSGAKSYMRKGFLI